MFAHLSPRSRYARFLGLIKELSPQMMRILTNLDSMDHLAIVALATTDGVARPLGIARFTRAEDDRSLTEAAVCVVDEAQRNGLGRILAVALGHAAFERGIRRFHGPILRDNEGVRSLLDEVGATFHTTEEGVEFEVSLVDEPPHPLRERVEHVARTVLRALSSFDHATSERAGERGALPDVEPR